MLAALCWIRMPQLRHIASALGVPCSSFRCVVQWPYSVSVACGYVREPGETGFIYGLQRLIPSAIYSVVWLQEREKLIDKDVEENGRVLIGGTIPVSSYTDWSKPWRLKGFVCLPAEISIGHLSNTSWTFRCPSQFCMKWTVISRTVWTWRLNTASFAWATRSPVTCFLETGDLSPWPQGLRKICRPDLRCCLYVSENERSVQCCDWKILSWVLREFNMRNAGSLYVTGERKSSFGLCFKIGGETKRIFTIVLNCLLTLLQNCTRPLISILCKKKTNMSKCVPRRERLGTTRNLGTLN